MQTLVEEETAQTKGINSWVVAVTLKNFCLLIGKKILARTIDTLKPRYFVFEIYLFIFYKFCRFGINIHYRSILRLKLFIFNL